MNVLADEELCFWFWLRLTLFSFFFAQKFILNHYYAWAANNRILGVGMYAHFLQFYLKATERV